MDRRRFLRRAGVVGIAGLAGCSTPFDPVSTPELANGSGAGNGSGDANGSGDGSDGAETPTPEAPETRSGTALTGVYPGSTDLAAKLSAYSQWVSKQPAVAVVFVDALGDPEAIKGFVDGPLTTVWKAGHVPLISWQPLLQNAQQTSERIEVQIADGKYDKDIETWAKALDSWAHPEGGKTRGRRFYFRPAHEMNGDWFPWSAVDSSRIKATTDRPGTPEDYVEMWRHLHKLFDDTDMDETDIQWVWSPNADEIGGVRTERYYPGDKFVDWIGIDGFNWGGSQTYKNGSQSNWRSPKELFDPMLNRMRELTDKPIALTEFASSSVVDSGGDHNPEKKAQWIKDAYSYVAENNIKMTCWFNHDKTGTDESDWAVFGSKYGTSKATIDGKQYTTYKSYKNTLSDPQYLGALSEYPPLLTDAEFAGKF